MLQSALPATSPGLLELVMQFVAFSLLSKNHVLLAQSSQWLEGASDSHHSNTACAVISHRMIGHTMALAYAKVIMLLRMF